MTRQLTPSLYEQFQCQGMIKLPQFVSKDKLHNIKQELLQDLKRLNIYSANKVLSKQLQHISPFQQIVKLSQAVQKPKKLDLIFASFYDLVNNVSKYSLNPSFTSQLLLSLPNQGSWNMEALNWHIDVSTLQFPGVQIFLLIDDVQRFGGATMALGGSHHLKKRYTLNSLRALTSTQEIGQAFVLDGHQLAIFEMCGKAGDIFIMDMRLLHTPSINSTSHLRMMATSRFFI